MASSALESLPFGKDVYPGSDVGLSRRQMGLPESCGVACPPDRLAVVLAG